MKGDTKEFLEVIGWILGAVAVVAFGVTAMCKIPMPKSETPPPEKRNWTTVTPYDGGCLKTVKHDGHLFIVENWSQKGAILHHPDCPCQRNPKLEN